MTGKGPTLGSSKVNRYVLPSGGELRWVVFVHQNPKAAVDIDSSFILKRV